MRFKTPTCCSCNPCMFGKCWRSKSWLTVITESVSQPFGFLIVSPVEVYSWLKTHVFGCCKPVVADEGNRLNLRRRCSWQIWSYSGATCTSECHSGGKASFHQGRNSRRVCHPCCTDCWHRLLKTCTTLHVKCFDDIRALCTAQFKRFLWPCIVWNISFFVLRFRGQSK